MAKIIQLTRGFEALVDDDDFDELEKFSWSETGGYAQKRKSKICSYSSMHRKVLMASNDQHVDHINGNSLDNRKCNLRFATSQQNCRNRRKVKGASSRFKGVSWHNGRSSWAARITINRRTMSLGYHVTQAAAARAYDIAALQYFGAFARPNFPRQDDK